MDFKLGFYFSFMAESYSNAKGGKKQPQKDIWAAENVVYFRSS